jgi:DNA-binding transcriptional ArsR family regulator
MSRDYGLEIDRIKEEIEKLKRAASRPTLPETPIHSASEGPQVISADGRAQLNAVRDELLAYTRAQNASGALAYTGTFCSGAGEVTRQSVWVSALRADDLLGLNDNRMVEKVLDSVGNAQRLRILLALLKTPQTVAQLVDNLGANTTGQIYHHLKPLIAADLLKEEKGVYSVIPYRVQGILMLLAGVWDLIDPRYTSGQWDDENAG